MQIAKRLQNFLMRHRRSLSTRLTRFCRCDVWQRDTTRASTSLEHRDHTAYTLYKRLFQ